MGVVNCHTSSKNYRTRVSKKEISLDLNNLTTIERVAGLELKYSQSIMQLYYAVETKLQELPPILFISNTSQTIKQLTGQLQDLVENLFSPLLNVGLSEPILNRSMVKVILESYLAILSLRKRNTDYWMTEQHYATRTKLLENHYMANYVGYDEGPIQPLMAFIQLLTVCISQQLRVNGHSIKLLQLRPQTEEDKLYHQLKMDYDIYIQ